MTGQISHINRLFRAIRYSIAGIKVATAKHTAFRQEILIGVVLTPIAIWLGEDGLQKAVLIGSLLIVLIVELVNSAIESVTDRIGTEEHPLSKEAKDLGSAAVFFSLVNVPLVWCLILFD